jgi:hypothetical protein
MAKGSDFEREICTQLSLWWTANEREDIFWRSSGSGARANTRSKRGLGTAGQHGDITATDPCGAPFTRLITLELKRGYNRVSPYDTCDRIKTAAIQTWEDFLGQAIRSWSQAKTFSWMLLTRRDRHRAFVWMPYHLHEALAACGAFELPQPCQVSFSTVVRSKKGPTPVAVYGLPWNAWLRAVQREHIEQLAAEWQ